MGRRRRNGHAVEDGDALAAEEAREEAREERREAKANSRKTGKEVAQAHERLNRLEGVLETARGKLQNEWKKLKEEGFNTKALKRARKDLREDPLDAQMDLEDYLTYRNLLGADELVQAARQETERAANGDSVEAAEHSNGISTTDSLAKANQEGLDAGLAGKNRTSNPYEEGSPEALKWDAGWVGGQRQNVVKMRGSTETAPAQEGVPA